MAGRRRRITEKHGTEPTRRPPRSLAPRRTPRPEAPLPQRLEIDLGDVPVTDREIDALLLLLGEDLHRLLRS